MNDGRAGSAIRCGAVCVAATAAALAVLVWLLPDLAAAARTLAAGDLAGLRFDELLVWLSSAVAAAGTCWLWAVTTVVALGAAHGRTTQGAPGVPEGVRRAVLAACGVALAGGLGSPALATPGQVHRDHLHPATATLVSGLPLPDRATGSAAPAPAPAPAPAHSVVVHRGDTLWSLARRELGSRADNAAVTGRWHAIYTLNRGVVGADPDVIHPGQQLRLPRD
jgi:LysM repeat protein